MFGAKVDGGTFNATLRVDLDASYRITGSAGAGTSGGSGQARGVELVFKDPAP